MTPDLPSPSGGLTADLRLMTDLRIVHGHVVDGRGLADPAEPVHDQGLGFDLDTIISRRRALRLVGGTFGALVVAACSGTAVTSSTGATTPSSTPPTGSTSSSTGTTESPDTTTGEICADVIPEETTGPFPGDGSNGPDVLADSGVIRRDITRSFGDATGVAEGVPLIFDLLILDRANGCAPMEGAAAYAWHCDANGGYSLYSPSVADQNYLRGVQAADADGVVRFTSIFPGCYPGRWPHIHFEVFRSLESATDASDVIATSQIALTAESSRAVYETDGYGSSASNLSGLSLASDGVFADDGGASQLATMTGDVSSGFTATLRVVVDT